MCDSVGFIAVGPWAPVGDDPDFGVAADRGLEGPEGINRSGGPRAGQPRRKRTQRIGAEMPKEETK